MNNTNETRNDMQQRNATTLDHYYNPCEGFKKDCENTAIRALLLPHRSTWSWLCEECAYEAEAQATQRQDDYLARRREEVQARQHGGDAA